MTLTQENLVKQIAEREDINVATVREIFKSAEDIIFDYLSSTTPSEKRVIKLLDGLSLECNYIPEKEIHTYDDIICKERISFVVLQAVKKIGFSKKYLILYF